MSTATLADPIIEAFFTAQRRLLAVPAERIIDVQTAPAAPLTRVLQVLHDDPAVVDDAVAAFLTAVNELCDGVQRKQGRVNRSAWEAATWGFDGLSDRFQLAQVDAAAWLDALRTRRAAERGLDVGIIEASLVARASARAAKDFATADRLQQELVRQGVVVLDHADGTTWTLPATSTH